MARRYTKHHSWKKSEILAGPSSATAGPGETFSRGPSAGIFFGIFLNGAFWYFIFLSDGGAPKRRRARGNLTPPRPLDEPEY